jgi:carbamoyltransferase
MIILGVSNGCTSGACLLKDGQLIAAVTEERFTRIRGHKVWPTLSIEYVLKEAGIQLEDIDVLAFAVAAGFEPAIHFPLYFDRIVAEVRENPAGLAVFRKTVLDEVRSSEKISREFDDFARANGLADRVLKIDHHEAHALGAFLCSPYDAALVVTCDTVGDFQSLTVSDYDSSGVRVLQRQTFLDSVGYFFGRITKFLGYHPEFQQDRVHALAGFGDASKVLPLMKRMLYDDDGIIRGNLGEYYVPSYGGYSTNLTTLLSAHAPADIAAAVVRHEIDLMVSMVRRHIKRLGPRNLCLSGSVFVNSRLNHDLQAVPNVVGFYVMPCMGNSGMSLSAAVAASYLKRVPAPRNATMFLGPDPESNQEIIASIEQSFPALSHAICLDITAFMLDALLHDQVLGLVRGRMEFSQRSLGNRTILYHAADETAKSWLNKRIFRSAYMPLAIAMPIEFAPKCLLGWNSDDEAAFSKTMMYQATDHLREYCPAAVHVDGMVEPQLVSAQRDSLLHGLAIAWHRETCQPALISQSFRSLDGPIILDARAALEALMEGVVDFVVVNESLVVWKTGTIPFEVGRTGFVAPAKS